ncbi:MAG: hypothetical protein H6836_06540 [Planctomycetes bacterium]|nr:hypothetical protein [Planctomycetota bacterium]
MKDFARSDRDPLCLMVNVMILGALVWIALAIGGLRTVPLPTPREEANDVTALRRTIESLERALTALAEHPARGTTDQSHHPTTTQGPPAVDTSSNARAPHTSREVRTPLAGPPLPTGSGALYDLAAAVESKRARANVQRVLQAIQEGDEQQQELLREFLLMDRAAVIRHLGKPRDIGVRQNGTESWNYVMGDNGFSLTIRDGIVISL